MDASAALGKFVSGFGLDCVGAGHGRAEVEEGVGEGAHARPADADEVPAMGEEVHYGRRERVMGWRVYAAGRMRPRTRRGLPLQEEVRSARQIVYTIMMTRNRPIAIVARPTSGLVEGSPAMPTEICGMAAVGLLPLRATKSVQ